MIVMDIAKNGFMRPICQWSIPHFTALFSYIAISATNISVYNPVAYHENVQPIIKEHIREWSTLVDNMPPLSELPFRKYEVLMS